MSSVLLHKIPGGFPGNDFTYKFTEFTRLQGNFPPNLAFSTAAFWLHSSINAENAPNARLIRRAPDPGSFIHQCSYGIIHTKPPIDVSSWNRLPIFSVLEEGWSCGGCTARLPDSALGAWFI